MKIKGRSDVIVPVPVIVEKSLKNAVDRYIIINLTLLKMFLYLEINTLVQAAELHEFTHVN